jgi:rhamnosyltransferase
MAADNSLRREVLDVPLTINSGTLFILKNLQKIGWHNRSYFVDGVDYEFCLRSHIHSFKIGLVSGIPGFDHESEQPDRVVTILGKRLLVRRYSAPRIKDALHSYIRLIYSATKSREFSYAFLFIRSMSIYLFGQILSRLSGEKTS